MMWETPFFIDGEVAFYEISDNPLPYELSNIDAWNSLVFVFKELLYYNYICLSMIMLLTGMLVRGVSCFWFNNMAI